MRQAGSPGSLVPDALGACFLTLPGYIALNIVELGLVSDIHVEPDPEAPGAGIPGVPPRSRLTVTLLAPPQEETGPLLRAQAENLLAGMPQWSRVTVELAARPVWSEACISLAGRVALGIDPPLFPILGSRSHGPLSRGVDAYPLD